MRLLLSALTTAALSAVLLGATSAQAFTVSFGTPTNLSTCSLAGSSGDRSCTSGASINNGSLDATASATVYQP